MAQLLPTRPDPMIATFSISSYVPFLQLFFYSSARDYKIQFFYFIPISLGLILASEASYKYDYIYVSCHVKMCNQKSAHFSFVSSSYFFDMSARRILMRVSAFIPLALILLKCSFYVQERIALASRKQQVTHDQSILVRMPFSNFPPPLQTLLSFLALHVFLSSFMHHSVIITIEPVA